jgi:hypothetical protein
MTYLEAAATVLKSAKRPLTTLELTEQAIERRLITPKGKTPSATMRAALYAALHDGRASGLIRQEYLPGPTRAMRNTVTWLSDDPSRHQSVARQPDTERRGAAR